MKRKQRATTIYDKHSVTIPLTNTASVLTTASSTFQSNSHKAIPCAFFFRALIYTFLASLYKKKLCFFVDIGRSFVIRKEMGIVNCSKNSTPNQLFSSKFKLFDNKLKVVLKPEFRVISLPLGNTMTS